MHNLRAAFHLIDNCPYPIALARTDEHVNQTLTPPYQCNKYIILALITMT